MEVICWNHEGSVTMKYNHDEEIWKCPLCDNWVKIKSPVIKNMEPEEHVPDFP